VLNILYVFFIAGFGFFTYFDWFYARKTSFGSISLTIAAVLANITLVVITAEPLLLLIYQIRNAIFGE